MLEDTPWQHYKLSVVVADTDHTFQTRQKRYGIILKYNQIDFSKYFCYAV